MGVGLPPPHGFDASPHNLGLWRRPPAQSLAWAERVLGGSVVRVRALKGGSTSSIHALRVARGGGVETVVLRRYVVQQVVDEEPDTAEREARVLRLLDRCAVPTPALLGVDPVGDEAGVPAVLMTAVPGRLDWTPADIDPWIGRLADVLPLIHSTPGHGAAQEFTPYEPASWSPPPWLRRPVLWERAVELFHGPRLDPDRAFIHRDYHPGNVLWRRGRVTGVVDWQAASVGPRSADVFCCRGNLLSRFGIEVADRFTARWEAAAGVVYHPWTEAVMLLDAIGGGFPKPAERAVLEDLLAQRLAELGA